MRKGLSKSQWARHLMLVIPIAALAAHRILPFPMIEPANGGSCVYVPGGGFSGFWFNFGMIQSVRDGSPTDFHGRTFYCYSAGCLSVVAALADLTTADVAAFSETIQDSWKRGEIDRFQVVDQFIDELVIAPAAMRDNATSGRLQSAEIPWNINILVTTWGVGAKVQRPGTVAELKDVLRQTTWIPFVTGDGLWSVGDDKRFHMDGGFSVFSHPKCETELRHPFLNYNLMINTLNVNIGRDKWHQLWNEGRSEFLRQRNEGRNHGNFTRNDEDAVL